MSYRKPDLLHSNMPIFQVTAVEHLRVRVSKTARLVTQTGPKLRCRILPFQRPCSSTTNSLTLPWRIGALFPSNGISVPKNALCKMAPFTEMCMGQGNRKKGWLTCCFFFYSVYRNNFPVTPAGLCLRKWCSVTFIKALWPLTFSGIQQNSTRLWRLPSYSSPT